MDHPSLHETLDNPVGLALIGLTLADAGATLEPPVQITYIEASEGRLDLHVATGPVHAPEAAAALRGLLQLVVDAPLPEGLSRSEPAVTELGFNGNWTALSRAASLTVGNVVINAIGFEDESPLHELSVPRAASRPVLAELFDGGLVPAGADPTIVHTSVNLGNLVPTIRVRGETDETDFRLAGSSHSSSRSALKRSSVGSTDGVLTYVEPSRVKGATLRYSLTVGPESADSSAS